MEAISRHHHHSSLNKNGSSLAAIKLPDNPSFNAVSSSADTGCSFSKSEKVQHNGATMTSSDENEDGDD